jgi:hypothetical protein
VNRNWLVLTVMFSGCGFERSSPQGSGTGSIALTAEGPRLAAEIVTGEGTSNPASGHVWMAVALLVENRSAVELPLLAPLFSVSVDGGLAYSGDSSATALLTSGCDPSASVAAGDGYVACWIVFSIQSTEPSVLRYRAPDGSVATTPLPAWTPCSSGLLGENGRCLDEP